MKTDHRPTPPPSIGEPLCCPVTRQPLRRVDRDGRAVLQTPDGSRIYPIVAGIPILLPPDAPNTLRAEQ